MLNNLKSFENLFSSKFQRLSIVISSSLILSFFPISNSNGQLVFGEGPRVSNFFPTNISPPSAFSPEIGVNCPVTSLSVTGFAGYADDSATNEIPFSSSTSSLGNYGVAAGVTVPLGRKLSKFCKELATIKNKYERKRVDLQFIDSQAGLIQQCQYLHQQGYDLSHDVFSKEGEFSAFHKCRSLIPLLSNLNPKSKISRPEKTSKYDQPFSDRPTITFSTQ